MALRGILSATSKPRILPSLQREGRRCQSLVPHASRSFQSENVLVQTLDQVCQSQKAKPLTSALLRQSLQSYLDSTPSAASTVSALTSRGKIQPDSLAHDHYAYRTLGLPGLGIASMAKVLNELGYTMEEEGLLFPAKKLTAAWFAYRQHGQLSANPLPRIFVSEIKVHELSKHTAAIIHKYAGGMTLGPAEVATACCTGQLPWGPITQQEYEALLAESDYAAWVMVHGYALNHTALAVHRMRDQQGGMLNIQQAADILGGSGMTMNNDGGLMKTSGDGLLVQCSTMSDWVPMPGYTNGSGWKVPGSYLELVERLSLPQYATSKGTELQETHRRDGFEVSNAAHLFTSTRAS